MWISIYGCDCDDTTPNLGVYVLGSLPFSTVGFHYLGQLDLQLFSLASPDAFPLQWLTSTLPLTQTAATKDITTTNIPP
jgi:hypothetical protein